MILTLKQNNRVKVEKIYLSEACSPGNQIVACVTIKIATV